MKFDPPPSPIRCARTSPEPSPCSSRNARTRSSTSRGGFVSPSASAAVSTMSPDDAGWGIGAILCGHAPQALPHAPRRGLVLRRRRDAGQPGRGPAQRRGARSGGDRARRAPRHRARPRRHERAAADARDGGDRRAGWRGRVLARAPRDPGRPALRDTARRARARVRARVPRRDPERHEVSPRRVDRRALRPRSPRTRAPRRGRRLAHGCSPSSTAASTGRSSPTR